MQMLLNKNLCSLSCGPLWTLDNGLQEFVQFTAIRIARIVLNPPFTSPPCYRVNKLVDSASTGETAPETDRMILSEAELSACVYMCRQGINLYVL